MAKIKHATQDWTKEEIKNNALAHEEITSIVEKTLTSATDGTLEANEALLANQLYLYEYYTNNVLIYSDTIKSSETDLTVDSIFILEWNVGETNFYFKNFDANASLKIYKVEISQIDDKFIPDSVARMEDINIVYNNDTPTISALGGIAAGTTFDNVPLTKVLDKLLYPYTAPTISLSASPAATTKEYGDPITSITFTATTTMKSEPITGVNFLLGSSVIHSVESVKSSGGKETFTYTTEVAATSTFKANVTDGQKTVTSSGITYTFVYPMYIGNLSSAAPTETEVKALSKLIKSKANQSKSYTITDSRFCFAYPKSYGSLTSVLDPNNFEILNDFDIQTLSFTMLDGKTVEYYVYTFKNITSVDGFTVNYKF